LLPPVRAVANLIAEQIAALTSAARPEARVGAALAAASIAHDVRCGDCFVVAV